jgi:hypothetical protein
MTEKQPENPLHGVTLERILTELGACRTYRLVSPIYSKIALSSTISLA